MTSRRPLDNILKPLIYNFASCKFVVPYNYVFPIFATSWNALEKTLLRKDIFSNNGSDRVILDILDH